MRNGLILFLLLLYYLLPAQSNEGQRFWLAFMEHRNVRNNNMVLMVSSRINTSGTLRLPGTNWSRSFTVAANDVALINLPADAETLGSEQIQNNGVLVETEAPVSVYIHQYAGFRSEATLVLPQAALGNDYYILAYEGVRQEGVEYPSSFLIVAGEDDTEITITPSSRTRRGRSSGQPFNINLDTGQTYQVQGFMGSDDLTGSYVQGNKPIAVFAGAKWTQVPIYCPTRDNLLEQMFPVSTYGRNFAAIPTALSQLNVYRVLAAEDGTQITLTEENKTDYFELNAGEWIEYQSAVPGFIEANAPIQVAQYIPGQTCNGGLADPSMFLLSSVEQTRDSIIFFSSALENINTNYINVLASVSDLGSITLDGVPVIGQNNPFRTLSGNPDYAYAQLRVSNGTHDLFSMGCGLIVTAYGYGNLESYAYSAGASLRSINSVPIPDGACLTDTLIFDSKLSEARFAVNWDFGDGNTASGNKVRHRYQALGTYEVRAEIIDLCLGLTSNARKSINIILRPALSIDSAQQICAGDDLDFAAPLLPDATYEWLTPDRGRQFQRTFSMVEVQESDAGIYEVVATIDGCMTFAAQQTVQVNPVPEPNLGLDEFVCDDDPDFVRSLYPGDFSQYLWQDGSRLSDFRVTEAGRYSVEVTNEWGCTTMDSIELIRRCPTRIYAPNVFSPNGDGKNDQFGVLGKDMESLELFIYNRWGNLVFTGLDQHQYWDGQFRGQAAPIGVYMWKARITGRRRSGVVFTEVETGTVTLVR